MENDKCVVVIPIYKEVPNAVEIASFRQCLEVLNKHEIVIVTHENIDLSRYIAVSCEKNKKLKIEYFGKRYFSSIQSYNELCLSLDFYKRFSAYYYLLIYQLDAWVFRDELKYWCDKGYDYIGAPLFINVDGMYYTEEFLGVGNGGFSLRRIQYCLDLLDEKKKSCPFLNPKGIIKLYSKFYKYEYPNNKNTKEYFLKPFKFIPKILGFANNMSYFKHGDNVNEDTLFGYYALNSWGIKPVLPSIIEAAKFSFEVHPNKLYNLISNKLPFGCHAFEKWDYETFWKQHIHID